MAKRGKKAAKVNTPTDRDRQDIRRLIRKAGSREQLIKWINAEYLLEDFDIAFLPSLAIMEETSWKYQRSPEARRVFKQRILELRQQEKDPNKRIKGRINYPFTREEIIRLTVRPFLPELKELGLAQSEDAITRRLIRKLRKYKPPN